MRSTAHYPAQIHEAAHPRLVTEMVMQSLAAIGKGVQSKKIQKRTRDDVVCSTKKMPWRRSATWLLMKVAMHTSLVHANNYQSGTLIYKNFMVYFFTTMLERSFSSPHDLQYLIRAKLARRIFKLSSTAYTFVVQYTSRVVASSRKLQEESWHEAIQRDGVAISQIDISNLAEDTDIKLYESRDYLNSISNGKLDALSPVVEFHPSSQDLITYDFEGFPILPDISHNDEDLVYALEDLEEWVSDRLLEWTASSTTDLNDSRSDKLQQLAQQYSKLAKAVYTLNPEQNSVMILTIILIWLALDRLACAAIPLLKEFKPELSLALFGPLLLPKKKQMARLKLVETHIMERSFKAAAYPSVFADPCKTLSHFSQKYYNADPQEEFSKLKKRIEDRARRQQKKKRDEWVTRSKQYVDILHEAEKFDCEMIAITQDSGESTEVVSQHDRKNCQKCQIEGKAESLKIIPFEWPLPKCPMALSAVLFELRCPPTFSTWRDLTWMIISDLGIEEDVSKANAQKRLQDYHAFSDEIIGISSRVVLASSTEPLSRASAKVLYFPVEQKEVCCENGLTFYFHDQSRNTWVHRLREARPSFARLCTCILPQGPYAALKDYVNLTSNSQNDVLASQASCPVDLSLHEYISFGSLRADGESTQWTNIFREVCAGNLNFNTEAVNLLITQAAWQVGSSNSDLYRISHRQLMSNSFCLEMASALQKLIEPTTGNWKSAHVLLTATTILHRVLNLNDSVQVRKIILEILSICRRIAYEWVITLRTIFKDCNEDTKLPVFRTSLLRAAMVHRSTYDLEHELLVDALFEHDNLRQWIICSLVLRQDVQVDRSALDN